VFPPSDSNFPENLPEPSRSSSLVLEERRTTDSLPATNGNGLSVPEAPWSVGFPMRPEILTAKPDISNLLHSLRRRKWLVIFLGVLLGGGLAAAGWFLFPPRYESTAMLSFRDQPGVLNSSGTLDANTLANNAVPNIKNNYPLLQKALDDPTV